MWWLILNRLTGCLSVSVPDLPIMRSLVSCLTSLRLTIFLVSTLDSSLSLSNLFSGLKNQTSGSGENLIICTIVKPMSSVFVSYSFAEVRTPIR